MKTIKKNQNLSSETRIKRKKRGWIFLVVAVVALVSVGITFFKGQKSFGEKREECLSKSGISYRSFAFSADNPDNSENPYPVYDNGSQLYYFRNPRNSAKLTEAIYSDARLSTGFYLNNDKSKSYIAAVK